MEMTPQVVEVKKQLSMMSDDQEVPIYRNPLDVAREEWRKKAYKPVHASMRLEGQGKLAKAALTAM